MGKDFTNRQGGGQKLNRLRRRVGAVLIEFAFAIPVFLVLIYYIHDLPKQKLLQRKMQFVAYEMAAILQSMATQKGTNGEISLKDLRNATRLAWLTYFPGLTQYGTGRGNNPEYYMPLGYMPCTFIYCVVGTGKNIAASKWLYIIWPGNPSISGNEGVTGSVWKKDTSSGSTVRCSSSPVEASSIYTSLKISAGEVKIIVECALQYFPSRYFSDGTRNSEVPVNKAFNFLLFSPKFVTKDSVFSAVSIFAPVGNAFSESEPQ